MLLVVCDISSLTLPTIKSTPHSKMIWNVK